MPWVRKKLLKTQTPTPQPRVEEGVGTGLHPSHPRHGTRGTSERRLEAEGHDGVLVLTVDVVDTEVAGVDRGSLVRPEDADEPAGRPRSGRRVVGPRDPQDDGVRRHLPLGVDVLVGPPPAGDGRHVEREARREGRSVESVRRHGREGPVDGLVVHVLVVGPVPVAAPGDTPARRGRRTGARRQGVRPTPAHAPGDPRPVAEGPPSDRGPLSPPAEDEVLVGRVKVEVPQGRRP